MAEEENVQEAPTEKPALPTGMLEVTAKITDGPESSVAYDFGENIAKASQKFGEDVVFSLYRAQAKIQLQARMRSWMGAEVPKDCAAMASMWKPGLVADRGLDPLTTAKTYLANLTNPEDKKAFLEELKAAL